MLTIYKIILLLHGIKIMEFCHFLFFLVKKENKKDVKCKAFTTIKLGLKKIKNPINWNTKNIRFSEKLSNIPMF